MTYGRLFGLRPSFPPCVACSIRDASSTGPAAWSSRPRLTRDVVRGCLIIGARGFWGVSAFAGRALWEEGLWQAELRFRGLPHFYASAYSPNKPDLAAPSARSRPLGSNALRGIDYEV